jgi:hypothetical protein
MRVRTFEQRCQGGVNDPAGGSMRNQAGTEMTSLEGHCSLGEIMLAVYTRNMLIESLISGIMRASPALSPHYLLQE